MRVRATALLLVVAALSAAGIAYSGATPTGLPKNDAVFGGGQFPFPTGGVRNFSLTAAGAEGTLQYSTARIRVGITCSRIVGNTAVVGGIIRDSTAASLIGLVAKMYLVDNGPPTGAGVGGDAVSPLEVFAADEDTGGLPKLCPAFDASQATQTVTEGDVSVHDQK